MAKIERFQDLIIWQRAMELAKAVYLLSGQYPSDEKFGFVSQMRRAATAIPSHIAEGFGRYDRAEYLRFLYMANGSILELETLIILSQDLGFLDLEKAEKLTSPLVECSKMIRALIDKLRGRPQAE